jgi:hypothetical protein
VFLSVAEGSFRPCRKVARGGSFRVNFEHSYISVHVRLNRGGKALHSLTPIGFDAGCVTSMCSETFC